MVNFMWEEGAGGWGPGSKKRAGEEKKKIATFRYVFCSRNGTNGGNHYGRGREAGVKGTGIGRFRPPFPPRIKCNELYSKCIVG